LQPRAVSLTPAVSGVLASAGGAIARGYWQERVFGWRPVLASCGRQGDAELGRGSRQCRCVLETCSNLPFGVAVASDRATSQASFQALASEAARLIGAP